MEEFRRPAGKEQNGTGGLRTETGADRPVKVARRTTSAEESPGPAAETPMPPAGKEDAKGRIQHRARGPVAETARERPVQAAVIAKARARGPPAETAVERPALVAAMAKG